MLLLAACSRAKAFSSLPFRRTSLTRSATRIGLDKYCNSLLICLVLMGGDPVGCPLDKPIGTALGRCVNGPYFAFPLNVSKVTIPLFLRVAPTVPSLRRCCCQALALRNRWMGYECSAGLRSAAIALRHRKRQALHSNIALFCP